MILVTLVLGALALFISYVYLKKPIAKFTVSIISLLVLITSLVFLTLNQHDHYAMHRQTNIKTTTIYPASSKKGLNIVLFKNIGTNGKETVQIYKKASQQSKPSHTQINTYTAPNNKVNRVNDKNATLKVKETRWVFNSKTAKFWFGISGLENKLIKRTNTFNLPKSWLYLSTTQAKTLQKKMSGMKVKNSQAKLKKQAQKYIETKLKIAITKDPSIMKDKVKQARLTKKYGKQFQQEMMQKVIAEIK